MDLKINEVTGKPELTEVQQVERAAYVASMKGWLDFLESHPELPAPSWKHYVNYYPSDKEQMTALVRAIGNMKKKADKYSDFFRMQKDFGMLEVEVSIEKEKTCTKVKVGTKQVTAQPARYVPAVEAHEVEVFEWQCPESILRANGEI